MQIDVKVQYLSDQSRPETKQYVFAYTITITNTNPRPVQLISRRWIITDENNKVQEVKGLGVVGEQPSIEPAQSYTYTSGAVLATKTGMMGGTYTMRQENGEEFEALIPTFALVQPQAIH